MKRFWLVPLAAVAIAGGLSVTSARSSPATSLLETLRGTAAEQSVTADVRSRRRCYRRCYWHRGHRHCRVRCYRRRW
jgi:hypothetical protein